MALTYDQIEAERAPFEQKYTERIDAVLLAQGEQLAKAIEDEDYPLTAFLDRDPMRDALHELWREVITHFAVLASKEVEALKQDPEELDLWQSTVQAFIESDGANHLIPLIEGTTLALVRDVLAEGIREGWSSQKIARELREQWPGLSKARAERIARTEVIRGSNYGSIEGAKKTAEAAGLQLEKVWLTAPVTGTDRDRHAITPGLDGQRRKLHEAFDVDGHPAMYPGDASLPPEESINCRCTLFYEPAQKSWTERRNEKIKAAYPALRDEMGYYAAMLELGEEHGLSDRQIKRIVYS